MKITVTESMFIREFQQSSRADNFSRRGLQLLFEYFEELEQGCGTEIEIDVIAICCDFSEEPLADVLKNYDLESIDELRDNTTVIEVDDETVIYQIF